MQVDVFERRVRLPCRAVGLAGRLAWLTLAMALASPASAQVLSGSYTGDGADNVQIGGLGFQPDLVIVKASTAQTAIIRTSTMAGDLAKPMTGATAAAPNLIQSLDATGTGGAFTVGDYAGVNGNGTSYNFVAFKAAARRLTVGTYTGNGTASQSISGVGFSPEFVVVMSQGAAETVFRSTAIANSFNFADGVGTANWITALGADGFTVGSDARVNANGTTYHYVAWNEVAGTIDVGTYAGNGGDQSITAPGFGPEFVLVKANAAGNAMHRSAAITSIVAQYFAGLADAPKDTIEALLPAGFRVGKLSDVNGSSTTYQYIAFRRESRQTEVLSGSYAGNGSDNRAITGLGFSPDVVLVKGNNGEEAVLRSYTMIGDASKDLKNGTVAANRIQTLDPEGFTVGNDARVNGSGVTYHWIAWKAGAGEMVVGRYTGNGSTQSIVDLGLSPDAVIVASQGGDQPIYRLASGTNSYTFEGGSSSSFVTALGTDGFTIGSDARVNASGTTYHFIAWDEIAGRMDVGTYSGNGADNRNITGVGFQPEFMLVQSDAGKPPVAHSAAMGSSTDLSHYFNQTAHASNRIQALQADGFQVGSGDESNESGKTFVYVAWSASALTAVKMSQMRAHRSDKGVTIEWRTGHEVDNLGFNVYRDRLGDRVKVNETLVAGSGLLVSRGVALGAGGSYRWTDDSEEARSGTRIIYWVQDVDLDGTRTWHGPIVPIDQEDERKEKAQEKRLEEQGREAGDGEGKPAKPETAAIDTGPSELASSPQDEPPPDVDDPANGAAGSQPSEDTTLAAADPADSPLLSELTGRPSFPESAPGGYILRAGPPSVEPPASRPSARKERQAPSGGSAAAQDSAGPKTGVVVGTSRNPTAASPPSTKPPRDPGGRAPAGRPSAAPAAPAPGGGTSRPARIATLIGLPSGAPPPPFEPQRRTPDVLGRLPGSLPAALQRQWSIAAGRAAKIDIREAGWYQVPQPALVGAGLPATVDPRTLQLFVDGEELPLRVTGDGDGRFDPDDRVEFFARGLDTHETDLRTYWLVAGTSAGRRLPLLEPGPLGTPGPAAFWHTVEHEPRVIFFAALMNGEENENYFGPLVMAGEHTEETLELPDVVTEAEAVLDLALQGVTELDEASDHRVAVRINGVALGELVFDGRERGTTRLTVPPGRLVEGANTIALEALGGEMDISLLDSIRLSYARRFRARSDRLTFDLDGGQHVVVSGFGHSAIRVFDVTGGTAVHELQGSIAVEDGGGWRVSVTAPGTGRRTLLATTPEAAGTPVAIRANAGSALHAGGQAGQVVMLTHAAFVAALTPLKEMRERQGYSVQIVDVDDIYDEFGFGHKSTRAIRDFMVRATERWSQPPRFLLLVGNATQDPRDYYGFAEVDYVPTRIVRTGALETASDDWFVDSDEDGYADLAMVGRLPARTAEQAATMISKIIGYEQAGEVSWQRSIVFVSDRDEQGHVNFAELNERARRMVPDGFSITHIVRGVDPVAGASLKARLNEGAGLVSYHGHGSVASWHSELLTADDVPALTNASRLPVVIALNCFNGFFHSLFPEETLAEALVRAPNGGAVGVWASSGMTGAAWQSAMNQELYRQIFRGGWRSIGEAMRAAKQVVGDADVRRTWIYFGDPVMRLGGLPAPQGPDAAPHALALSPQPHAGGPDSGESSDTTADEGDPSDPAAPLVRRGGIRLVDFDGDGRDDVFLLDPHTGLWFSARGGPGEFAYVAGQWSVRGEPAALEMNGDGRADMFVYDAVSGAWLQALSLGDGRFATYRGSFAPGYQTAVADFDGDGRDDVLAVNPNDGSWSQATATGHGSFTYRFGAGLHRGTITTADFSGDGRADALVYDVVTGRWTLLAGGAQVPGETGTWGPGWQVAALNLNGDAREDLLLWHPSSGVWVHGLSSDSPGFVYRTGTWANAAMVQPLDLSGNGRDEILAYDPATGSWTLMAYDANGELRQWEGVWEVGWSIAAGDLNGARGDDLLLYNPDTGQWVRRLAGESGWRDEVSGAWPVNWMVIGRKP